MPRIAAASPPAPVWSRLGLPVLWQMAGHWWMGGGDGVDGSWVEGGWLAKLCG